MANISYNQTGFTYNEQYSSYHGFKSIDNCTTYNEIGLSYNEIGYPYHGICNITILPESMDMTISLPDSDIVFVVTFQANVLNLLLSQPIADISTTSNVSLSPSALSLVLSLPASQVSLPKLVSVNPLTLTLSTPSSTVEAIRDVYLSPDVLALLLSLPQSSIEAIQNLNISIIPRMSGAEVKPHLFVQDVALKSMITSVKLVVNAAATNSRIYDQGFTYNEAGYTYNDMALSYEGIYGDQYVKRAPQIVKNIRPIFS